MNIEATPNVLHAIKRSEVMRTTHNSFFRFLATRQS